MSVAGQIREAMDAQNPAFEADVLSGLARPQKTLPSRWLYDDRGSELFEDITELEEYYPTRTERAILEQNTRELAEFCGEKAVVIEYGAGASVKSEVLLAALRRPKLYVPIDIAGDFLAASAARLRGRFKTLAVLPVAADFTQHFELPDAVPSSCRRTAVFLGSTIGNLAPSLAEALLAQINRHVSAAERGPGGRALIGIDLEKSLDILVPAYNDSDGVTAQFNLNLLERINRELDGTFNLEGFRHEARWNPQDRAIEMHLVSRTGQQASIRGRVFTFSEGETIHTESSRKYTPERFAAIAAMAGWRVTNIWTDDNRWFAVVGLEIDERFS